MAAILTPTTGAVLPSVGGAPAYQPPGGTIQLSVLIDFIVQRTYHELQVLSELLPRKTDMERKIEIVQFCSRTRQLFVRLLALVKWANNCGKVDKCAQITGFLDQQAMLFVHTADRLAQISRDSLPQARLSAFAIPHAIDVLTTGTYPRLPACIKEKILPPDPITTSEIDTTLKSLTLVIRHRLATRDFPPQMSIDSIARGQVHFRVNDEFQASLTLMGDSPSVPWRLLDIDILVDDLEASDGKALVHSLQVQYIHQLVQARLYEATQPLHDLYNILHAFCLSLQLEVLFSQTIKLRNERLGDVISIDNYTVGKSLQLGYWRNKTTENGCGYAVTVQVNPDDARKPLFISHSPLIEYSGRSKELDIRTNLKSEKLSIEKLLVETAQTRSVIALDSVLAAFPGAKSTCALRGTPPVLSISILEPCVPSEMLNVAVSIRTGNYQLSIPVFPSCDILSEMEGILNGLDSRWSQIDLLLAKLRIKLTMHRCRLSVQHLPVLILDSLPLVGLECEHSLSNLGPHIIYMKLLKHPGFYLVYELKQGESSFESMFYMLQAKPCRYLDGDLEVDSNGAQLFLQCTHFMELDKFMLLHGPATSMNDKETLDGSVDSTTNGTSLLGTSRKRLAQGAISGPSAAKAPRSSLISPYLVPELPYVISVCDDRIPFIALQEELNKHGIRHQGVQTEGRGLCLQLSITAFPVPEGIEPQAAAELSNKMLQCTLRMQGKVSNPRVWVAEFLFRDPPIESSYVWEQQKVRRVLVMFEQFQQLVPELLMHWLSLVQLHWSVAQLGTVLDPAHPTSLHGKVELKCFNYKKVTLGYGPNMAYHVNIGFSANQRQFVVTFGSRGGEGFNGHVLMAPLYLSLFNSSKSLPLLAKTLVVTSAPIQALVKLSQMLSLGVGDQAFNPNPGCSIIPQSPTHFRLACNGMYVLDIVCQDKGMVTVRDGAFSKFDCSSVVEGFVPIQGLKSFLMQFVDAEAEAGRLNSADDNPPSPVGVDAIDTLATHQTQSLNPRTPGGTASPAGAVHPRSNFPMTPSPANPLTPASPAGGVGRAPGVSQSHASPGAAFPSLTSPSGPSHHITPSPMMGTPSPGTVLTAASPGNMHVPSPSFGHAPSPGGVGIMPSPSFISPNSPARGGPIGIPASPRQANLGHPGAPNPTISQPSLPHARQLPSRPWAASVPTRLTHEALNTLCTPCNLAGAPPGFPLSPLERFFGCSTLRKHVQRLIAKDDCLSHISGSDTRAVIFQTTTRNPQLDPGLTARILFNPSNMLSLHLKVEPIPHSKDAYSTDELLTFERFFDTRVAIPPYKINSLTSFMEFFHAPVRILKDVMRIMTLDICPGQHPTLPFKWSPQICLTMPPQAPQVFPPGYGTVMVKPGLDKILLLLQLSRVSIPNAPPHEINSISVPVYHEISSNQTNYLQSQGQPPSPFAVAVAQHLQRFNEQFRSSQQMGPASECSLFPAVKDLLLNLILN